jgi:hypothetical protein
MAKASPKTLRPKCLVASQKLARLQTADDNGYAQCVSCRESFHYKEMDGGHFIPKGNSSYWALEMININPQCKGCNSFGMKHGTAAAEYTLWMEEKHGEGFVRSMIEKKKNPVKWYTADYRELLSSLNSQIKFHETRIGS